MRILQPPEWARPRGYANGVVAEGAIVFVAGQIGWEADQTFSTDDFAEQTEKALRNTLRVLAEAGAGAEHIARMTWYVTSRDEYHGSLPRIGACWRALMGRNYPAMSVVEVSGLMEGRAKIEIEVTAVLPRA